MLIDYAFTVIYNCLQEMGIKDEFHLKSILVCVDDLCDRNPDKVFVNMYTYICVCV